MVYLEEPGECQGCNRLKGNKMTPGNKKFVDSAPIQPTPKSPWGVKLHEFKFDYYAPPKEGDGLKLSWQSNNSEGIAHCTSETEFIEVMSALYARLFEEAHKRAAEAAAKMDPSLSSASKIG